MENQSKFYTSIAGFTLGIFFSSFFKMGFSFFLFLCLISLVLFIFYRFVLNKKSFLIIFISLFIFSFSLGILRYEIKDIKNINHNLLNLIGEKIILIGVVVTEPSIKDDTVDIVIQGQNIIHSNQEIKITDKVLVTTDLFPEINYGDQVQIEGKLMRPANFSTELGKDFDYVGFLAKEDIFYQVSFAQLKVISSGHGSFLKNKLLTLKKTFVKKLNLQIKEPESALLTGLILGAKNSLGQNLQADFRRAGVSHIVALSGYNITIVAEGIMIFLSLFLSKSFALFFGAVGILFFAIMTGGSATVMRASIMALLVLLAKVTGRKYDISRALLLAGVFMLIQNPKILVFDTSFQLSFLATIALILLSPLIEKRLTFITNLPRCGLWLEKWKIKELIGATIATQIFVLPFIIYKMGMVSIFSLPANLFILPVIPLIMLLGFLTGILGFISNLVALPIAFICSLLLTYVLKVIYIFSHLPLSALSLQNFPFSLMILIYFIYLILIIRGLKPFFKINET